MIVNMVHSRQELEKILDNLNKKLYKLGVRRIGLFGSFARGDFNNNSDVDLIVTFEPDLKSINNFMSLVDLLEGALGRRVEILTENSISPYFSSEIIKETSFFEISA